MRYIKPFNENKNELKDHSLIDLIAYCNNKISSNVDSSYFKSFKKYIMDSLEKELESYKIKNYTINDDLTIDVDGDVDISGYRYKKWTKIPFKFGKVTGDFDIPDNDLESLEDCPYYVGGSFNCDGNKIKSLKYSPSEVVGNFCCANNRLNSLEGMTLEIGGSFECTDNPLLKELDSVSNIEGFIYCDKEVDISKFKGYCTNIRRGFTNQYEDIEISTYDSFNEDDLAGIE